MLSGLHLNPHHHERCPEVGMPNTNQLILLIGMRQNFILPQLLDAPSDFVTFPAGMTCTWKILKGVRKHYSIG